MQTKFLNVNWQTFTTKSSNILKIVTLKYVAGHNKSTHRTRKRALYIAKVDVYQFKAAKSPIPVTYGSRWDSEKYIFKTALNSPLRSALYYRAVLLLWLRKAIWVRRRCCFFSGPQCQRIGVMGLFGLHVDKL